MQKDKNFIQIYNKSYRLSSAVFAVCSIIGDNKELKTRLKILSLNLVSLSVGLKGLMMSDIRRNITDIEKTCMELMSLLSIASISGVISDMNALIIKNEFNSFLKELSLIMSSEDNSLTEEILKKEDIFKNNEKESLFKKIESPFVFENKNNTNNKDQNNKNIGNIKQIENNGYNRKNLRKENVFNFIKGHNNSSIKDILPHIVGCSEKTVQRELIELVKEGKIRKVGERRWSRYSVI